MCSLADQLVEFFSVDGECGLMGPNPFHPYIIRKLVRNFVDERDRMLWSSALNAKCKFVRLSSLSAIELITERGRPFDGVSLFDATGNPIKYPMLPVAIVQVVKRNFSYEQYVLLEQLY